ERVDLGSYIVRFYSVAVDDRQIAHSLLDETDRQIRSQRAGSADCQANLRKALHSLRTAKNLLVMPLVSDHPSVLLDRYQPVSFEANNACSPPEVHILGAVDPGAHLHSAFDDAKQLFPKTRAPCLHSSIISGARRGQTVRVRVEEANHVTPSFFTSHHL